MFFRKKTEKGGKGSGGIKELNLKVKRSNVEIFLAKNRHHSRLSEDLYKKIYGYLINRSVDILVNAGKGEDDIERMLDHLLMMFNYRRGLTIPTEIDANSLQRYREISTCSLMIMYLTRIVATACIGVGVQVQHQGELYTFSPYQDYLFKSFEIVGKVNHQAYVLTSDVTIGLRFNILNDLFYNSPMTMQWYGMFPDMLKLVYRHLEDKDEAVQGIYGSTVDRFVTEYFSNENSSVTSVRETEKQSSESTVTLKIPTLNKSAVASQSSSVSETKKPTTVASTDRTPLKVTPEVSNLFSKISGSRQKAAVEPAAVSVEENLQCKKSEDSPAPIGESDSLFAMSPVMQKLKLKVPTEEQSSVQSNKSEPINLSEAITNIIRDVAENSDLFKVIKPVSRATGEISSENGIMITLNTYKVRLRKLGLESSRHEILNYIRQQKLTFLNERNNVELNNGKDIVMVFRVREVETYLTKDTFDIANSINVEFDDVAVK